MSQSGRLLGPSAQVEQEKAMSDISQGAGWWQASDGKWYPPEQHPNYRPAPPPPAGSTPGGPGFTPGAPGPTPGPPGFTPGTPGPAAGPKPPPASFSFDVKRWSQAEGITFIATLILFVSLFLPWFTYNFGLGSVSVDGLWHGWMYLVLLLCLAIMADLVIRAGFSEAPFTLPVADEQLLLIATCVNAVLSILAFLLKPGGIGFSGIGWGLGAFLGLIAAIVAAAPMLAPVVKGRGA
jgi:hypothetical protein